MTNEQLKSDILKHTVFYEDLHYDRSNAYPVCYFGKIDSLEVVVNYGYSGLKMKNGRTEECFLRDEYLIDNPNRIAYPLSKLNLVTRTNN
jgi:hypothetical protein